MRNALRAYWSYALSLLGLVRIQHEPLFVSVEPANICQLRCPACPVGLRNTGIPVSRDSATFISREVWQRTLEQITPCAHTIQFYFQGEPLLHKDLPQMIAEAHEAGLYTIISTNAQAMTPQLAEALVKAGLNRIIISMDGLTDASYNAYRVGGNVEQCKKALRWLHDAKADAKAKATIIELQCLRLRTNEHEWKAFKQQYKALGADRLVFKTAQLYDYTNGHPLMPTNPRYSRYTQSADGRYHRKPLSKTCLRAWTGCVITTIGEVLPCCYDKAHAHAYGNIMERPLKELFSNEKAIAFRQAALTQQPLICQECYK
ncbi:MAG: radical SAM protein [Paludibacteraceae bacterium]|nr:radical SAM protein [Paludibacteraceae bacterium]